MSRLETWDGNEENIIIEYDCSTEMPSETTTNVHITLNNAKEDSDNGTDTKADKVDCLVAASCGMLTGFLDVFWVGEFSLKNAQNWGREKTNGFVVDIAQMRGYKKEELSGAIRFLEKDSPIPSDRLTNVWGGALQHHFRDFAHHASIAGLAFSILTQFTGRSYGTDTDGRFQIVPLPEDTVIGSTFEEKLFNGIVIWALHLVSDMAGSSGSAGRGTGIPGPLLSLLKEASVLPHVRDISVQYEEEKIDLSVWLSKLYNGTAFPHESYKDVTRLDLRTELGIYAYSIKQEIPVAINQCAIRAFYLIKHLCLELKRKKVHSIRDLKRIEPQSFLPFNNRCIARMSTISTGVFSVVDVSDSAIRAYLRNPKDKAVFATQFLLRLNFAGIGKFFFSLKVDAGYVIEDIKGANQLKATVIAIEQDKIIEGFTIDLEVEMDNSGLYEYAFYRMFKHIVECKHDFEKAQSVDTSMQRPIYVMKDDNAVLSDTVASMSCHSLLVETEELVMRLFALNKIDYIPFEDSSKYSYLPFFRIEDGKRIAYFFSTHTAGRIDWQQIKEQKNIDGIKVVALVDLKENTETLNTIIDYEINLSNGFVQYETLKDLFDLLSPDEYTIYKKYVDKFNSDVMDLIGFSTVTIPSREALQQFKKDKAAFLKTYDFHKFTEDIFDDQIAKLNHNFFERELYKALVGDTNFAESFISSEWYFNTHIATSGLEQTAIVAGYLKSVEQLMYEIIRLSIDTGKTIKEKGSSNRIEFTSENEDDIDSTLGVLIGFFKHYSELWDVNKNVKFYITDKLTEFRQKYRNDHFHKDNVYEMSKIEEIRRQTIAMHYYLLGGCRIDDEKVSALKIHPDVGVEEKQLTYFDLENWLNRILGGDTLLDSSVPLYFMFKRYGYNPISWELQFDTISRFNEKGFPEDLEYPFVCDSLFWSPIKEYNAAEAEIIDMIKLYLQEGKYAAKLKRHKAIAAGRFGGAQIIYGKL